LEDGIRAHDLVGRELDAGRSGGLKALHAHGDLVPAGADELDVVLTLGVGGGLIGVLRAGIHRHHRRTRKHPAAVVGHGADQRRLGGQLRRSDRRETETASQTKKKRQRARLHFPWLLSIRKNR
jgi:hypothetical protein